MKRAIAIVALCGVSLAATPATSLAADPGTQGQPSQSCQSFFGNAGPFTPTGFNTSGFTFATGLYAGAQTQNSSNPKSVSQYDVACFQAASR